MTNLNNLGNDMKLEENVDTVNFFFCMNKTTHKNLLQITNLKLK